MNQRIEVEHVDKTLSGRAILKDVSLTAESGKIYSFIGRNGSGKTVFFKCLLGFMPVTAGRISQNGQLLGKHRGFLKNTGFLIEQPGFLDSESGLANLLYLAAINRRAKREDVVESIKRVGLDPSDRKRVGKYSMGMRQRLGIAQAIMENPDILILDEPMNGLDDRGVQLMRELLIGLRDEGKLIMLASHYKEDVEYLSDEIYRFDSGVMVRTEEVG